MSHRFFHFEDLADQVTSELLEAAVQGREDGLFAVRNGLLQFATTTPLIAWSEETSVWRAGATTLVPLLRAAKEKPFHARPPDQKSSLQDFLAWSTEFVELAVSYDLDDSIAKAHGILTGTDLLLLKLAADQHVKTRRYGGLKPEDINDPDKVAQAIEQVRFPFCAIELTFGCSLVPREPPKDFAAAIAHDDGTTSMSNAIAQFGRMLSEDAV